MNGRQNKTKHAEIVKHNLELIQSLPNVWTDSLSELERTCWACGFNSTTKMTRCHVIPACREGPDSPENYFLLCDSCHDQQPDGRPRKDQEHWLRNSKPYSSELMVWVGSVINKLKSEFGEKQFEIWSKKNADNLSEILQDDYSGGSWGIHNSRANCYYRWRQHLINFVKEKKINAPVA